MKDNDLTIDQIFEGIDIDNKGVVPCMKLFAYFRQTFPEFSKLKVSSVIKFIDQNYNGFIDKDELKLFIGKCDIDMNEYLEKREKLQIEIVPKFNDLICLKEWDLQVCFDKFDLNADKLLNVLDIKKGLDQYFIQKEITSGEKMILTKKFKAIFAETNFDFRNWELFMLEKTSLIEIRDSENVK